MRSSAAPRQCGTRIRVPIDHGAAEASPPRPRVATQPEPTHTALLIDSPPRQSSSSTYSRHAHGRSPVRGAGRGHHRDRPGRAGGGREVQRRSARCSPTWAPRTGRNAADAEETHTGPGVPGSAGRKTDRGRTNHPSSAGWPVPRGPRGPRGRSRAASRATSEPQPEQAGRPGRPRPDWSIGDTGRQRRDAGLGCGGSGHAMLEYSGGRGVALQG